MVPAMANPSMNNSLIQDQTALRTTPANLELFDDNAEESLLAAIITAPELFQDVTLDPNDFHSSKNRLIWKAIIALANDQIGVDNITIADWLEAKGVLHEIGGPSYIGKLLTALNGFNIQEYTRIIKGNSRKREALNLAGKVAKLAGSKEILDGDLDNVIADLANLKNPNKSSIKKTKQSWTIAELLDANLPEPKWAIPGLVPEGLTLLGGRPKVGKSWLALQMAHSIGTGGMFFGQRVEKGNVLYIALEDGPRRLQDRIRKHQIPRDALITFERDWPPLQDKGMDLLFSEIVANDYRLVVIDTLTRGFRGLDQNDQPQISLIMADFQRMFTDRHLAILFNDHVGKPKGFLSDPVDDIMNSTVKTAIADQVLALYRESGQATATLKGRGRDVEDVDFSLRWDPQTCCWQYEGQAGHLRITEERQDILDALEELGRSQAPAIAKYLGKDRSNIAHKLNDLHSSQLIKREIIGSNVYYERL